MRLTISAGKRRMALSIPAIVGRDGVEAVVPIDLSGDEAAALRASAETLRKVKEEIM